MSITTGSELTLGVLFKGRVDAAFKKATGDLRSILGGLSGAAGNVNKSFASAGKGAKQFTGDIQGVGKHAMKTAQGFQRLTNSLKFIAAYSLAGTAIWGTVNALKSATKAIIDYDQALKNLQAITSATDVEIMALGSSIIDVASTTKFSATEVAEAAILLGQAGFTASEQLSAIGAVANLATGTLTSMATSADLLTTAIRAFSLDASEAGKVSDVFASAVNRSKLTIDKLRIAFNYLGPVANQVGLNLEETAAGAMLLANAGLRGSTIGTGFRRVLQMLVKPTEKMRVLIAGTGVDIKKLNPAVNDMSTIMANLQKILGKNVGEAERARRAFELFGLRGASVAAVFAEQGAEGFNKMYDEVLRVGTASKMAEKQMEGLGVMIKNTMDKIQVLAITIGEGGLADALRFILVPLRGFIDTLIYMAGHPLGQAVIAVTSLTLALTTLRLTVRYVVIALASLATGETIAVFKETAASAGILRVALEGVLGAAQKLFFFLKGNIWFTIFAVVSSVAVALLSYKKHLDNIIPSIQKTIIEKGKLIEKLKLYKKQLAETKEGTAEYKAIVQRMGEEFEELKPKIDAITGSFTDSGKAVDDLFGKLTEERFQEMLKLFDEYQKRIKKIKENIEWYRDAIEREGENAEENAKNPLLQQRAELGIDDSFISDLKDAYGALDEEMYKNEALIEEMADKFVEMGLSITSSVDVIKNKLTTTFGVTKDLALKMATEIKRVFDKRQFQEKADIGSSLADVLNNPSFSTNLQKYGDLWVKLYNKISEARKVDLIETIDAMQKKLDELKESLNKRKITQEQYEAKRKQIIEETYNAFANAETEKEKRARQTAQKVTQEYQKMFGALNEIQNKEVDNWYADLKAAIDKNVSDVQKRNNLIVQLDKVAAAKRKAIALDYYQYTVKAQKELTGLKSFGSYNPLNDEGKLMMEISDEYKEMRAKELAITYRYWDEWVRTGVLSVEQYRQAIQEAEDANLITTEDAAAKRLRINENVLTSFVNGWKTSLAEVKTLSELMFNIGEEMTDKLAGGLSDGIWDFIDGTKTAQEAFRDFASDMLEWLAKLILKWSIMKALQSAAGFTGNSSLINAISGALSPVAHTGGIIGRTPFPVRIANPDVFRFAPKLHNGLMPGEFPAILKKGEGVFTPEQMKAMGSGQVVFNSNVTVQVGNAGGASNSSNPARNEALGRDLARVISNEIDRNIQKNLRPGGIIDERLRKMRF